MRRSATCLPVLFVVAAAAFGLDLTTFRQSYSRASRADWLLSANAGLSNRTGYFARQSGDLSASLHWKDAILSDDFDLDATVSAGATGNGSGGGVPDTLPADAQRWSAGVYLSPTATCHKYLFGTDAFFRAGMDAGVDFDADDERSGSTRERSRDLNLDLSDVELGVGYGRMRDAWPLYRAARLAGILREEGVLNHELTDDELRDLGGFLSRSWKLFYAHDRAAKFYYDSLEQWLMHAGAISQPLPAYTLFRLDETPLIGTDTRRFGMRGFFTANLEAHRRTQWFDATDTSRVELDTSFRRSYQVGWEFNRPVGLRWTYGASASYILPWPHQLDVGLQRRLELTGSASYDITDRLVAGYNLDLQPFYQTPISKNGPAYLALPAVQTLEFSYYVSGRFAVRLGGNYATAFDCYHAQHYCHTDFRHRWAMALTMTFGRIPENWGRYYYL